MAIKLFGEQAKYFNIYCSPSGDPDSDGEDVNVPTTLLNAVNLIKAGRYRENASLCRIFLLDGIYTVSSSHTFFDLNRNSTLLEIKSYSNNAANVTIKKTSNTGGVFRFYRSRVSITDITIENPFGDGLSIFSNSLLYLNDVQFTNILYDCVWVEDGSYFNSGTTIKFFGVSNPSTLIRAENNSYCDITNLDIDFANYTINFSTGIFTVTSNSVIHGGGVAFLNNGSVAGKKFSEKFGHIILNDLYGNDLNSLIPGTVNGSTISNNSSLTDENVAVSLTDTTPGTLSDKLASGANIGFTILNQGANEQIVITAPAPGDLNQNAVSAIATDNGTASADAETDTFTLTGTGGLTTSATGKVITLDASGITGGAIVSPSPQPIRESYVGATASLADDASEDLDLPFPIAAAIANIATDVPALVRAYSNKAARTADARDNITPPTIPTAGLIFEYRLQAGQLSEEILPVLGFVNLETQPAGEIYLRIFNESGAASAVSVSLEASPIATAKDRDSFIEETISAPKQLQSTDPYLQNLNPGTTADQYVYAPSPPTAKDSFQITNTADPQDANSKNILWSEDGGTTTHYTIEPGRYITAHYGTQWRIFD